MDEPRFPQTPPAPPTSPEPSTPPPSRMEFRLSGPAWLAATGATLLLVASVIVVAGRWSAIGPTARFAGLVGALFAVFFTAEAARTRLPATATSLAVLAACVTAPVGIAAVAALDGRWPICIAVGGGAALVASELQSRRWKVRALKAATVAALLLSIGGAADLLGVPAAILCSIASIAALGLGAERRSVVIAMIVPFAPCAWFLAELDIGPGVLGRMGLVDTSGWTVAVSSSIAGLVIAVSAHRTLRADLAAAALAVMTYAGIAALIASAASASVWLSVPGVIAAVIAVAALGAERSIFSRWSVAARPVVATILSVASWGAPFCLVAIGRLVGSGAPTQGATLVLPATVTLGAMLVLAATVERTAVLDDIVRLGCVAAAVAVVAASDVALVWVAVLSLVTWLVTSAITSWRSWIATSTLHAVWAVVAVTASNASPAVSTAIVVAAATIVVVACFSTRNTSAAIAGIPVPVTVAAILLASNWPGQFERLAASIAVGAAIATGVAMRRPGVTPGDSLAVSLGWVAAIIALGSDPAGVSLGLALFAAQVWMYGVAFRHTEIAAVAAGVGFLAMTSLWWTTGTNGAVIAWLAPHGASGQDVALAATALAVLGGGAALRRVHDISSWLAYSPGSSLTFSWLLVAQSDTQAEWATLTALIAGVVFVAIGGVARLAAPLVIGTFGLVATGVVSVGSRLASAPTWTWIASGGAGLLVIAALLERSERPLLPDRTARSAGEGSGDGAGRVVSVAEAFSRTFR